MYESFFGFKERPFSLLPNSQYLFLGKSHEEALAHLMFAVTGGDGFALVTGEVGTGKTTLCRAFLARLNERVNTAYLFHSRLDDGELLAAVLDEFGIAGGDGGRKAGIDALNQYLLAEKQNGRTCLVLIDEAQNLTDEALEQVRLLSNLETETEKLIIIILVGQPELALRLDRYSLRQLAQRITIRTTLLPFTPEETKQYIAHRLQVAAGRDMNVFTSGALGAVHKKSAGTPRLINMICDRALLAAYTGEKDRIGRSMVSEAVRELGNSVKQSDAPGRKRAKFRKLISLVLVLVMAVIGLVYGEKRFRESRVPVIIPLLKEPPNPALADPPAAITLSKKLIPGKPVMEKRVLAQPKQNESGMKSLRRQKTDAALLAAVPGQKGKSIGQYIETLQPADLALAAAARAVLSAWGENTELDGQNLSGIGSRVALELLARQARLNIKETSLPLETLLRLNHPVILRISGNGRKKGFAAILNIRQDSVTLIFSSHLISVKKADIQSIYDNNAFILWRDFSGIAETIPETVSPSSLLALKLLLRGIGADGILMTDVYDEPSRRTVMEIQKKYGLVPDGVVGSLTKIALYNEKKELNIPRLVSK